MINNDTKLDDNIQNAKNCAANIMSDSAWAMKSEFVPITIHYQNLTMKWMATIKAATQNDSTTTAAAIWIHTYCPGVIFDPLC